jgi:hypothetical protein
VRLLAVPQEPLIFWLAEHSVFLLPKEQVHVHFAPSNAGLELLAPVLHKLLFGPDERLK